MKSINIVTKAREFENIEEVEAEDRELILAARESCVNAYAPYSKFRVGAALKLENGSIVLGTNIENAAFPSGICAERSALYAAASNHPFQKPVAIAIAAMNDDGFITDPVPPCGNCRQVIAEEEMRHKQNIRVILSGKNKTIIIENGGDLLPFQFNQKNLNNTTH